MKKHLSLFFLTVAMAICWSVAFALDNQIIDSASADPTDVISPSGASLLGTATVADYRDSQSSAIPWLISQIQVLNIDSTASIDDTGNQYAGASTLAYDTSQIVYRGSGPGISEPAGAYIHAVVHDNDGNTIPSDPQVLRSA